jgi:hypothetical protein
MVRAGWPVKTCRAAATALWANGAHGRSHAGARLGGARDRVGADASAQDHEEIELNSSHGLDFLFELDLCRKPVPTFRHHAPAAD